MNRPPAVPRDLFGRCDELPAGVVHEDVDRPELSNHPLDERLDLLGISDIRLLGDACGSGGVELRTNGLERLGPPPADRDEGACPRELERGCSSDASTTACHKSDRVDQVSVER